MYSLFDTVALTRDIPAAGLRRGDVGAIVEIHQPESMEVEFVAASGRTQALLTLGPADVRSLGDHDLITVRSLEEARG